MNKKLLIFFFFLLINSLSYAYENNYSVLKDTTTFFIMFKEQSLIINTVQSNFIQEKHLDILSDTVKSYGEFYYKKPSNVRWEYTKPFNYLIVINKNTILIKNENKIEKYNTKSNKIFNEINNKIMQSLKGEIITNDKEFIINYLENNLLYLAELVPRDKKQIGQYIKSIEIYIDKKDFSVSEIAIYEPNGDYTKIKFNNKKMNLDVKDETFIIN
jgi:outer membrane lipoprotein-sorting protein